jgi:hypothetical protein
VSYKGLGISLRDRKNSLSSCVRTIPTERPPLVDEVSVKFCGQRVSRGQSDRSLRPYSLLLDRILDEIGHTKH